MTVLEKIGFNADDSGRLADVFQETCCSTWDREHILNSKIMRFAQTYLAMSRCGYRPAAPGDGMGNINLTSEQLNDVDRLYVEAVECAVRFAEEEDAHDGFDIGISNYSTNRAFILTIESARILASGSDGNMLAINLLRKAIREIKQANRRRNL